jgi:hypothetical protein
LNPPLIMKASNGLTGRCAVASGITGSTLNLNLRGLLLPEVIADGLSLNASRTGFAAW